MGALSIKGTFYDGQNSGRHVAELVVGDDRQVMIHGVLFTPCALQDVVIPSRVGSTARMLRLPDGSLFETSDNAGLDRIATLAKVKHPLTNPHYWESKKLFVLAALAMLVIATYAAITMGIPAASEAIAKSLPPQVSAALADGTMDQLDRMYLRPTKLPQETQQHYRALFSQLLPEQDGFQFRLSFRSSRMLGANAFVLPSGDIVVTDELIKLAQNDQEVIAVLYHEVGHVVEHHSLRQLLEVTGTSILFAWILEDVEGIANLLLTAPLLLVQTAYSRGHESEADTYALEGMMAANIDPIHFSNIMDRLSRHPYRMQRNASKKETTPVEPRPQEAAEKEASKSSESAEKNGEESWWHYLSTHPSSDARVRRFEQASEEWKRAHRLEER